MRKSRYHRDKAPDPIQVDHPNYLDILAVVASFHKLHTNKVQELLPHRSKDRIIRRLSHLHDHEYLERTAPEHRNYLVPNEHWITQKGLDKLAEHGRFPSKVVRRPKGEGMVYNTHILMVNNYLASVMAGAGPRFIPMPDKRLSLPYTISYTFEDGHTETRTASLRPDGVFAVRHGEYVNNYLVECENTSPVVPEAGGLRRSSFLRKALAYYSILVDKKAHKELLGLRKVRVIVTAPTLERLRHKMAVIEKLYGANDTFLFAVLGDNMFATLYYRVGMEPYSLDKGV